MATAQEASRRPIAAGNSPASDGGPRLSLPRAILLFAGFALLDVVMYRRALLGGFISDDALYLHNVLTSALTRENLLAIFDPQGLAKFEVGSYAPIHWLLTAVERYFFGNHVFGYHLVNVALHALNSVLLSALFVSSGIPIAAAILGALVFTVHPANVEAVAWMSQLKTTASMAFALGALLTHRRHPVLATAWFSLAVLTKPTAVFALPMAAAFTWVRRKRPDYGRWHWISLGAWAVLFCLYLVPQLAAHAYAGLSEIPAYEDRWVHVSTIASVAARYFVMAATSYGLAPFQEVRPAFSPWDPWFIAGVPLLALLAWRMIATARRDSQEFAYWACAAASFAPVSQILPLALFTIADRHLYFILPGLIGASLLAFMEAHTRLAARPSTWARIRPARWLSGAAGVGGFLLAIFFARESVVNAGLWRNADLLMEAGARRHPEGGLASFVEARHAAQAGDVEAAIAALRRSADLELDFRMSFVLDPALAPIRETPAFRELIRELAGRRIEYARSRGKRTSSWLRSVASAHMAREEYHEAIEAMEQAIRAAGPGKARLIAQLDAMRARVRALEKAKTTSAPEKREGE